MARKTTLKSYKTAFGLKTYAGTNQTRGRPRKKKMNKKSQTELGRRRRTTNLESAVKADSTPPGFVSVDEHFRRIAEEQSTAEIEIAKAKQRLASTPSIKEKLHQFVSSIEPVFSDHVLMTGSIQLGMEVKFVAMPIGLLRELDRYLQNT